MRNFLYIFLFVIHVSSVSSYEDPTKFKDIDPKYMKLLTIAQKKKLKVLCFDCKFSSKGIVINNKIKF